MSERSSRFTLRGLGLAWLALVGAPQTLAAPMRVNAPRHAEHAGAHVPYNQAVQKSTHNAYARKEPLFDQLAWHGIRSLELDVHVGKASEPKVPGDWFVYHEDLPFFRSSSCTMLSDCVGQLAAFHTAVPDHDVVTLWIDLKDDFTQGHAPEDLDRLLEATLGRENLVTPSDLRERCPDAKSLRDAVTGASNACSFPTLDALRGKFIVATTGGSSCDASSPVTVYGGALPETRAAFLAPDIDASCPMSAYDPKPSVVFLNLNLADRARAKEVRARGLVPRIYAGGIFGGLDSEDDFSLARESGSLHLATDMVSTVASAWATTWNGTRRSLEGHGWLSVLQGVGDDIGGKSDSFWFSYDQDDEDAVYRTFASVPNSHADPHAKACFMARADETAEAANVAICRTFDGGPLGLQVRKKNGDPTTFTALTGVDGVSLQTPAFMRLGIRRTGDGSEVVAEGSSDGIVWRTIAQVGLDVPLPLRGLAVSSHGKDPVTAVFGRVLRLAGAFGRSTPTFGTTKAIGENARGPDHVLGSTFAAAGIP